MAVVLVVLAVAPAVGAETNGQADWPCQQPLVPTVSAGMVWDGPSLDQAGDWRSAPEVAALVAKISTPDVSTADGQAAIAAFLAALGADRQRAIERAVAGLIEENNQARTRVIDNIEMLTERQRGLADVIARLTAERDAAGQDAPQELVDRWTFAQRTYHEGQQTLRYACEMPATLDQRLGIYARALAAGLP